MSSNDNKTYVISGEAYWAHILRPNTKWKPEGEYSVEVCNLDEANLKVATEAGLEIKNKSDERGKFVTLKGYATHKDGSPKGLVVKDSQLNPFISDSLVGNGSKINAMFFASSFDWNGSTGVRGNLLQVQVVELIPYGGGSDFEVVPNGYVSSENVDNEAVDFPLAS